MALPIEEQALPEGCHEKKVVQPGKKQLIHRLNRIAGQIKGVTQMVESDRYCIDILTQVSAVQSALNAVALRMIEDHTQGCVQKAIRMGNGDEAITELMEVLKKLNR